MTGAVCVRPGLAPGYQGRLFAPAADAGPCWWRVVDAAGTRQEATRNLVMVIGQTRALAMADARAWIVASDDDAVSVTYDGTRFSVLPCRPGWPATTQRSWPSTAWRRAADMSTTTAETTAEATDAPIEAMEPEAMEPEATEATGAAGTEPTTGARLVDILLEQLRTNPLNLRRRVGDIKALTKSIAEVGIVVPLIVTPSEDGTYLLAAGERRLTAARAAGLVAAPCVVSRT